MKARSLSILIRAFVLGIVAVLLFFKTKKTKKIQKKLENFTFTGFELFFDNFLNRTFDTDFIGLKADKNKILYFNNHKGKINIEFEIIEEEQQKLAEKLHEYAKEKGYKVTKLTYQRKTNFNPNLDAKVLQIKTNLNKNKVVSTAKDIFINVFNCNENTTFDMLI